MVTDVPERMLNGDWPPMDEELVDWARERYLRSDGEDAPIPGVDSEVVVVNGAPYVLLRNVNGVLAVFRADLRIGRLCRLSKWPAELDELAA